jgi:hypothetical protein
VGLARCPFPKAAFAVKDGRQVEITNSEFGAVYSVVNVFHAGCQLVSSSKRNFMADPVS